LRKSLVVISTLLLLALSTNAFAQLRGKGRQQGVVTDSKTGKPVADATVTLTLHGGNTAPVVVKTDSRGRWAAIGLTSGNWDIDITASGYNTLRGSVPVAELQMNPQVQNKLEPAVVVEAVVPASEIKSTPLVPQEAIDAIKEGQELLKSTENVKENAKKAVADFEKALPLIPTDKPEIADVRRQLQEVLAQAYYRSGDLKNAIGTLEKMNVSDPWSTPDANQLPRQILLANLYLENKQLDEAKALVDKLPDGAIADPNVYINMAILFLNNRKPADANANLTKAIALDAKVADAYYYRGLALMQLKKNKEAKADFEQVLALAPADAEIARDAKQLIAGLK
jgi:tetratricopeptide (TPR) repeat protein